MLAAVARRAWGGPLVAPHGVARSMARRGAGVKGVGREEVRFWCEAVDATGHGAIGVCSHGR
jgi:hypothetical protein